MQNGIYLDASIWGHFSSDRGSCFYWGMPGPAEKEIAWEQDGASMEGGGHLAPVHHADTHLPRGTPGRLRRRLHESKMVPAWREEDTLLLCTTQTHTCHEARPGGWEGDCMRARWCQHGGRRTPCSCAPRRHTPATRHARAAEKEIAWEQDGASMEGGGHLAPVHHADTHLPRGTPGRLRRRLHESKMVPAWREEDTLLLCTTQTHTCHEARPGGWEGDSMRARWCQHGGRRTPCSCAPRRHTPATRHARAAEKEIAWEQDGASMEGGGHLAPVHHADTHLPGGSRHTWLLPATASAPRLNYLRRMPQTAIRQAVWDDRAPIAS